jgi:hypothetical protein
VVRKYSACNMAVYNINLSLPYGLLLIAKSLVFIIWICEG